MPPIRSTHGPVRPLRHTSTDSAISSAASSSMSKRAPNGVAEPVRRAAQPSKPSSTIAAVDTTMIHQ